MTFSLRSLVACLICGVVGLASWSAVARADTSSSSLLGDGLVVPGFEPLVGGQVAASEEAMRASPEAVTGREVSSSAYEDLGAEEAQKLTLEAFPTLISEPSGGPPRLPSGERIVSFPTEYSAALDLGSGVHGVLSSQLPIAAEVSGGRHEAIDLGLTEVGGDFQPRVPAAGVHVRISKRLANGASLGASGVSVVPVDEQGAPLGSMEGVVDGASVFYANTEAAQAGALDMDTVVKPATLGVSTETILRSERSPEKLFFKIEMPAGALLVQDVSGSVDVVDAGRVIAMILAPSARDAEGTIVPVQMSVSGDTVVLTVLHQPGQYRMPIDVDPTAVESQTMSKWAMSPGWWFSANSAGGLFSNFQSFTGTYGMEDHGTGGEYASTEYGLFGIETSGESRIYKFVSESFNKMPAPMTSVVYVGGRAGIEGPAQTAGSNTVCVAEGCAAAMGSSSNWGNGAFYKQAAVGNGWFGPFEALLKSASLYIVQEKGPVVKNTGSCGSTWAKTSACSVELNATDPGIGISEWTLSAPGTSEWGGGKHKAIYCTGIECQECIGKECPELHEIPSIKLTGLPDGEDAIHATVQNATGASASSERNVKIDNGAPHNIVLSGLPTSSEIGAGEYKLKVEASDGTGTSPATSGITSISLYVDGREVGTPSGSCSPGPCTAHSGEWTIFGREYATGHHTVRAFVVDGAGNTASETFAMIVHPASPVGIGPGQVNPQSGEFSLASTDVSMGGGLTVSRSYRSQHLTSGAEGPVSTQWGFGLGGQETLVKQSDGSMVLTDSNGGQTIFASNGSGGFISPPGDANLTLSSTPCKTGATEYRLKNSAANTSTCFSVPTEGGGEVWTPSIAEGPVATDTVTYAYTTTKSTQYSLPEKSGAQQITTGPDGNLWFTEHEANKIAKMTTAGSITTYSLPAGSWPSGIASGPDGNLWFTDNGSNKIGKITTAGVVTEYAQPAESYPGTIATGPDGNLWFTEWKRNKVVKITTSGTATEYSVPAGSTPLGITAGPDGNLWFANQGTRKIGKITTSGAITEYSLAAGSYPDQITSGADGNLWFTTENKIGKITTSGAVTEYALPEASGAAGITVGSDKNIWFAEFRSKKVGRITPAGTVLEYSVAGSEPRAITSGPDGNIWYAEYNNIGTMPTLGAISEPTEALAPVPAGVSCSPELKRGCRALTFNYAPSTTATGEASSEWGDYSGHLTRVYYTAYDPSSSSMKTVEVAHYIYDKQARMRAVWDPRISPELKTTYGYDSEGHVTSLTPPGQESWALTYGTSASDSSPGRLLKALQAPASTSLWGGEAVKNTSAPSLSGSAVVGVRMAVSNGSWTGSPIAYGYVWEDCNTSGVECAPIPGADNPNYTPVVGDVGHKLVAVVAATNGDGSITAATTASAIVANSSGPSAEYSLPAGSHPFSITSGPDGKVWFTDTGTGKVGKATTSGSITEYAAENDEPEGITTGSDGNLWFVEHSIRHVNHMTTSGSLTVFTLTRTSTYNVGIAAGADKNLWFTEASTGYIGKFGTKNEVLAEYALPTSSAPYGITAGPEEKLWFAEFGTNKIGKITTSGAITEYALPAGSQPYGIAAGPEEKVWFTDYGTSKIGKITTGGGITEYALPAGSQPRGITQGPEGYMWFTDYGTSKIGKISSSGAITEYALPAGSQPNSIATGPDGELWYVDYGTNKVAKFDQNTETQAEAVAPAPGTTIEYNVPLSGSELPTMSKEEVGKWAQTDYPAEATAIFPPDEPQSWPATHYKRATIYYRDSTNRTVNVASPGGAITTSEYNEHNDVIRSLSADNREAAIKEGAKSAEIAQKLDTQSEYNSEGNELLSTLGPRHTVKLSSGTEVLARSHTVYHYDEGAPETGGPYRLVTKMTQGAQIEGEADQDVRTTTTSYSGQEGLGWTLRQPTAVTTDPAGLDLVHATVYDKTTGNVVETKAPGGTVETVYPPAFSSAIGSEGSGNGQFNHPERVAIDASENIWVDDKNNARIEKFSSSGSFLAAYGTKGSGNGQFSNPWGLAINTTTGNIYVSDTANNRIEELNSSGAFVRTFGTLGSGNGQLDEPAGLTIDSKGNVWVTDEMNNRVEEFSETGAYESQFGAAGTGAGQFKEPFDIAISEGELYVVDYDNNRIQEFSPAGTYLGQIGSTGSGPGQFKEPEGIAVNQASGNLLVSDSKDNRVEEFTPAGKYLTEFGEWGTEGPGLDSPTGLAVGHTGKIYITNQYSNNLSIWQAPEAGGARMLYSTRFGSEGGGEGQFNLPVGTAVDGQGNVWVVDYYNGRVQKFSPTGQFIASYGTKGSGNGQFLHPTGIAINASTSNVYVGDCGNNRVEEITTTGGFVRVFGTEGTEPGQFKCMEGLKIDPSGNVWVADTKNNRIQKFSATGTFTAAYGTYGTGNGQFNKPEDIAFSGENMYVTDNGNNRVQELTMTGTYLAQFGTAGTGSRQFKGPEAIVADSAGHLFVDDNGNNRVQEFNQTGGYLATFGTSGTGEGQLSDPLGMAINASGDIYITNANNNTVEIWAPAIQAVHDTKTIYYTSGTEAPIAACRNHAEWANMPCQTEPAAQPATEGLPALPVTTITYDMYGQPLTTTSTVGTDTSTAKTSYDAAGRPETTEITSTVGKALPKVSVKYSETTGALIEQSAVIEGKLESITNEYNKLGQITSYTDASENTTKYEYEGEGPYKGEKEKDMRLKHVDDGKGTQTYAYDETTGHLKEVADKQGTNILTFTAAYDIEGNMTGESYPNGMSANYTYNQIGATTAVSYVKTTHCTENCTWYRDSALSSIHGQRMTEESTLAAQSYTYDQIGRLVQVQETPVGEGCTTRIYGYDEETNRTGLVTRTPGVGGVCATEGGITERHTYDSVNRLTDPGVSYDSFGDTTKLPAGDAGGSAVESSFYSSGVLESQTQNGQTIAYQLDPSGRARQIVDTGTTNSTTINHYAGPSDSPSWTLEPVSSHWSRDVSGISGFTATESDTEGPVLALHDLHGDIVATASTNETATKLLSTERPTEYGVPSTTKPARYGWLGSEERATELSSGVMAMGARSYIPQLGRFLQTDPVPGGSANTYAYVFGDPVNSSDPSGEYTNGPSSWAIELASQITGEEVAAYEAALRAEAERKAAEAAAAAAAYAALEAATDLPMLPEDEEEIEEVGGGGGAPVASIATRAKTPEGRFAEARCDEERDRLEHKGHEVGDFSGRLWTEPGGRYKGTSYELLYIVKLPAFSARSSDARHVFQESMCHVIVNKKGGHYHVTHGPHFRIGQGAQYGGVV
jgi:RHS repeat-associated protein